MLVDLDIKLTQEIRVKDLILGTQEELKRLIHLSDTPDIEVNQMDNGIRSKVNNDLILQSHGLYLINFKETEDIIELIITEIESQPPYIPEEESGKYLGLSVRGKFPVKFLLAGAVALWVSRICGTRIVDESCFWSKNRESDLDMFLESIRFHLPDNQYSSIDLQFASQKFYETLPKGV